MHLELQEVSEEIASGRVCHLEDELGDVLWDYLNFLLSLEKEGRIQPNRVFERAYIKYSERMDGLQQGKTWAEIKLKQKERLATEQAEWEKGEGRKALSGRSELVVALDVETLDQVKKLVSQLGPEVEYYKIGHQLMTSEGPTAIHYLKEQHKTVFLDLKLHEIPNSVTAAVRSAGRHGVDMVSVHASGGQAMMKAAVAAAEEFSRMKVVALTVVTGLDQRAMNELGWHCSPLEQVIRLTELAVKSGCHGVIASSQEAKKIKGIVPKDFLIITPGIRLAEDDKGDQVRSGTPAIAALNGATHLVVGRPIIQAQDPAKVARRVVTEVEEA